MNATVTESKQIPVFTLKDKTGKLPESFKHGFITRMLVNVANPPPTIRANNGQTYQAVYDNVIFKEGSTVAEVIISFQSHTYGNFAIIRNAHEPKGKAVLADTQMIAGAEWSTESTKKESK